MSIPTKYANVQFRSRLEARWAAFFDAMQWKWDYEPTELDGWIPDFRLNFIRPIWVEIKPEETCEGLEQYEERLEKQVREREILLLGDRPMLDTDWSDQYPTLGRLCEVDPEYGNCGWDKALWMVCGRCYEFSFYHATQTYRSRLCGHYDGDHLLGTIEANEKAAIDKVWKMAGNATQWNAKVQAQYEYEQFLESIQAGDLDTVDEAHRR